MTPYLLKRRLRHIRSIKLSNVAIGEQNSSQRLIKHLSCFISLETNKGQPLYISELQRISFHTVQFNELPPQDNPLTHIVLKIIISVPKELKPSSSISEIAEYSDIWFVFREYFIELNKLKRISQHDCIVSCNAPVFEMMDGIYVLPDASVMSIDSTAMTHDRTPSNIKIKQSFSFNSVLKLNKILDYTWQVKDESAFTSHRIDELMKCEHGETTWRIESIKRSNDQLKINNERKKLDINSKTNRFSFSTKKSNSSLVSQNPSLHDYYGNTYSELIQIKNRLEGIRIKKIVQLMSIFQETPLFDDKIRFVEYGDPGSVSPDIYNRIKLNLLRKERILKLCSESDVPIDLINASLGYYLLFVLLMAKELFEIPLPYSLYYYGSTSIVEKMLPFYLEESFAAKSCDSFSKAIDYFNKDVLQVIQHLELRRTP